MPAPAGNVNNSAQLAMRAHLAVIIPSYNAGPNVSNVIRNVLKVADCVIVVDDGSTDGSLEALDLPVRGVVRLARNQGKGAALLQGFTLALEDDAIQCAVVVDADGQHNAEEIPRLYQAFVEQEADLVIGARDFDQAHVPWASWLGNTLTRLITGLLVGRRLADTQSGFRLHSRRFLQDILSRLKGGRYETEMEILVRAIRGGYKVVSVPIQTIYEDGNPTSHFRKLRDSWLVWSTLVRSAFKR